jgi:hypothetical protein
MTERHTSAKFCCSSVIRHGCAKDMRSISEIKEQIKYSGKKNFEILEQQSNLNLNGKMPDHVDNEIKITNAKIKMLKWAIFKWLEWDCKEEGK